MGLRNKVKGKTERLAGKAKASLGKVTNDPDLTLRGRADQVRGNLRQVAEKIRASVKR
jgi:uncharacterized protein YjbJ (UPF0337 family)